VFSADERAIAQWQVTNEDAMVYKRYEKTTVQGVPQVDAIVRYDGVDAGTFTEYKTLEAGSVNSVHRNVVNAGYQLNAYGGGQAVIDGRPSGLSYESAVIGYSNATRSVDKAGNPVPLPDMTKIILGDNGVVVFRK